MRYPVVIHKDEHSDFCVSVPDIPGCYSAGSTYDEALTNVIEAIECHLEGLLMDNEECLCATERGKRFLNNLIEMFLSSN